MGVERGVTLWYIQHQFLLDEIALLQAQLAQLAEQPSASEPAGASRTTSQEINPIESVATVRQQIAQAHEKLHALGPCPKPMMG